MKNDNLKRQLWLFIKQEHASLATLLTLANKKKDSDVRVSGHPPATQEWIRDSLMKADPAFTACLERDLDPILASFKGSDLYLPVATLINALSTNLCRDTCAIQNGCSNVV
ncbi:MAG: hypothetical protein GKR90_25465 [Pseudomonadales bacterium]|nr:hypothetical protein [Pseudomonadales bacterium]